MTIKVFGIVKATGQVKDLPVGDPQTKMMMEVVWNSIFDSFEVDKIILERVRFDK